MRQVTFLGLAIISILLLPVGCGGGEEAPEQAPVARPVKLLTVGGAAGGGVFTVPGRVRAGKPRARPRCHQERRSALSP